MGEVLEIAKALVTPCEKLIDAVTSAIGKAYEPRHMRKMADAKAYEIQKITGAIRLSSDMSIVYDKGDYAIDTTEYDELVRRMQSRLAFQEICKQKNIEAVIDNAYGLLESLGPIPNDPIDPGWMIRFFNSVEDISDETLQEMWGRLLAGEITSPGNISLRTLSLLKNMSREEAEAFQFLSKFAFSCKDDHKPGSFDYFIPAIESKNKFGILYSDIMELSYAGLISDNNTVCCETIVQPNSTEYIYGNGKRIHLENLSETPIHINVSAYFFTQSGKELYCVLFGANNDAPAFYDEYMKDCLDRIIQYGFDYYGDNGEEELKKGRVIIRIEDGDEK